MGTIVHYYRGDEYRSEHFKAIRSEVVQVFPDLSKRQQHRIAIFILKQCGASFMQCFHEAGSATIDHTMLGLRWTEEKMEGDTAFAEKVRAIVRWQQRVAIK